jgi:hypothetical protein
MAVNNRDVNTLEGETGWPVVNYAIEDRNFQTSHNNRAGALSIPRFKFTHLVEFQINPRVLENPITNIHEFVQNGKIYTHLLTLDHPSPTFKTEKLRSYNKWINVPTQVEFPQASMTFHDDSTSVVMALWKEYLNFYTHLAQVGDSISGDGVNSNLSSSQESDSYQFTDRLIGEEMRSKMEERPSLGMKLKANDMRHFFDSIVIYDLGTEPDGINIYWYHNPFITGWAHDNIDKEDRTGNQRITASFDYESYYFTIGQNRGRLSQYIQTILGAAPENVGATRRKDGIGRDGRQSPLDRRVENGSAGNQLSFFPGEDEFARQGALVGAGLAGTDQGIASSSLEEQLASPAGLNSPAKKLEQTLRDVGADLENQSLSQAAAQTFPLGAESRLSPLNPTLVEPLAPFHLNSEIPASFKAKGRLLEQAITETQTILQNSQGRKLTPSERKTLSAYDGRSEELLGAMRRQVEADKAKARSSPATASALANTKTKLN